MNRAESTYEEMKNFALDIKNEYVPTPSEKKAVVCHAKDPTNCRFHKTGKYATLKSNWAKTGGTFGDLSAQDIEDYFNECLQAKNSEATVSVKSHQDGYVQIEANGKDEESKQFAQALVEQNMPNSAIQCGSDDVWEIPGFVDAEGTDVAQQEPFDEEEDVVTQEPKEEEPQTVESVSVHQTQEPEEEKTEEPQEQEKQNKPSAKSYEQLLSDVENSLQVIKGIKLPEELYTNGLVKSASIQEIVKKLDVQADGKSPLWSPLEEYGKNFEYEKITVEKCKAFLKLMVGEIGCLESLKALADEGIKIDVNSVPCPLSMSPLASLTPKNGLSPHPLGNTHNIILHNALTFSQTNMVKLYTKMAEELKKENAPQAKSQPTSETTEEQAGINKSLGLVTFGKAKEEIKQNAIKGLLKLYKKHMNSPPIDGLSDLMKE